MVSKRRQMWNEVKAGRAGRPPRFRNANLMAKAVGVAEQILRHKFVLAVGVFGSTARGEDGNDVDLLIVDDGTVSTEALEDLRNRVCYNGRGFSSVGAYANACYIAFAEHMPGKDLTEKLRCSFYEYIRGLPSAIDLVFVGAQIKHDQRYLDELVLNGNDPFFFQNIGNDTLLFKGRKFQKDGKFPQFVNGGRPSADVLGEIASYERVKEAKRKLGFHTRE